MFGGEGGEYLQMVTPSEVWVAWRHDGSTFLLVGDLPPDHIVRVLSELPQPEGANLLSRLWRGLFG